MGLSTYNGYFYFDADPEWDDEDDDDEELEICDECYTIYDTSIDVVCPVCFPKEQ